MTAAWLTPRMVNLSKLAKTAKGLADKHGDKIAAAVEKTTDMVDKKTKGKYTDKLTKVDDMAKKLDTSSPGDAPSTESDEGGSPRS
jgi:hypothetical protein